MHGKNLLSLSRANIDSIEKEIALTRYPFYRINCGMAELTRGETVDWALVEILRNLAIKYSCVFVCTLYTQWTNSKYARSLIPSYSWEEWRADEELGYHQDWKNPNGIKPELEAHTITFFAEFCARLGTAHYYGLDNEPCDTIDKYTPLWGDSPVGYVTERFRSFQYAVALRLKNLYKLVGTAWEADTIEHLTTQIHYGEGLHLRHCKYQLANWYITKWLPGDTPRKWAIRTWSEITKVKRELLILNLPLIVSEIFPIGIPNDEVLIAQCKQEFLSRVTTNKGAFWFDYYSNN